MTTSGEKQQGAWIDYEEKDEEEVHSVFTDEDLISPSEAKAEQVLAAKLALDATDMGTLPGALSQPGFFRTASFERFDSIEERRLSSLSQRHSGSFVKASPASETGSTPPTRNPRPSSLGMQRLRASPSSDRLEELSTVSSPREYVRRSSNLSQMLATLKKSPSVECVKSLARDQNTSSPPPPPPCVDGMSNMGGRKHSNLAVVRLLADTI